MNKPTEAEIAKANEIYEGWKNAPNENGICDSYQLIFAYAQALKAHGQSEYERGLEDAAKMCDQQAKIYHKATEIGAAINSYTVGEITSHLHAKMIRALKRDERC